MSGYIHPSQQGPRTSNKLLASLPSEEYNRIATHLKMVPMQMRQRLLKQDEPIREVFFPSGGACSIIKSLRDGQSAEVATVGREGAIGAGVFFGQCESPADAFVHVPGATAHAMPVEAFTAEMDRRGAFFNCVVRYHQALMTQIMQTTVCNGLHSAEQRCCRWLLMAADRIGATEFPLTHDFLAMMLGVRRPTVTLVLASLQRDGLIQHTRGHIVIVDKARLEEASCECYTAVKESFSRLLPDVEMAGTL